jgi:hypothetical protein
MKSWAEGRGEGSIERDLIMFCVKWFNVIRSDVCQYFGAVHFQKAFHSKVTHTEYNTNRARIEKYDRIFPQASS